MKGYLSGTLHGCVHSFLADGIIQVSNKGNGQSLGYISKNFFSFGGSAYTPTLADALVVNFCISSPGSTGQPFNMKMENANVDVTIYPYFGAVQGRDSTDGNLYIGNFNYAYLAGISSPTPANSPPLSGGHTYANDPSRLTETCIWSLDANNILTVQWTNVDTTLAKNVPTVHGSQSTANYLWGDANAFQSRFPAPIIITEFTFISTP